jgi:hypothetical protein
MGCGGMAPPNDASAEDTVRMNQIVPDSGHDSNIVDVVDSQTTEVVDVAMNIPDTGSDVVATDSVDASMTVDVVDSAVFETAVISDAISTDTVDDAAVSDTSCTPSCELVGVSSCISHCGATCTLCFAGSPPMAYCANVLTDRYNCQVCGRVCASGMEVCRGGRCY